MQAMAIALLIAVIWTAGTLILVAICRAAARGDRGLERRRRPMADSHEFGLVDQTPGRFRR